MTMNRFTIVFLIFLFLVGYNALARGSEKVPMKKMECTKSGEPKKALFPLVSFNGYTLCSPYKYNEIKLENNFKVASTRHIFLMTGDRNSIVSLHIIKV